MLAFLTKASLSLLPPLLGQSHPVIRSQVTLHNWGMVGDVTAWINEQEQNKPKRGKKPFFWEKEYAYSALLHGYRCLMTNVMERHIH